MTTGAVVLGVANSPRPDQKHRTAGNRADEKPKLEELSRDTYKDYGVSSLSFEGDRPGEVR